MQRNDYRLYLTHSRQDLLRQAGDMRAKIIAYKGNQMSTSFLKRSSGCKTTYSQETAWKTVVFKGLRSSPQV